jgi:hypothetical protein
METRQMRQRHVPRRAALDAVDVRIYGQNVSLLHTRCICQEISWKRRREMLAQPLFLRKI